MNENEPTPPDAPNDPPPENRRDWEKIVARTIKFLAIALGMVSVGIILIVGLALGACFLSKR
jgi:hypothetical protein